MTKRYPYPVINIKEQKVETKYTNDKITALAYTTAAINYLDTIVSVGNYDWKKVAERMLNRVIKIEERIDAC